METLHEVLSTQYTSKGGRIYARTGGVSEAVENALLEIFPDKLGMFSSEQASGIKECKEMLKKKPLKVKLKQIFFRRNGL